MELKYDFHLHSCLSPCADNDMTPHNLVGMAKILGYDIIALTDHNSAGNCRSAMAVGERLGITVIPGMELCTSEEIHVVCLFPDIDAAESFGAHIAGALPPVKNKPDIFGEQRYMDAADTVTGLEEILLVTASSVSIDEAHALVGSFGGFCYPAHIDRPSFSITASLGTIPPELGFTCAEVTPNGDLEALCAQSPALRKMRIMRSSDAHYLENMPDPSQTIELPENTTYATVRYLRSL